MTADFDFDTPRERRGTDSEKWQRWAGRDVLPLWVADMDFAAPPPVIDALRRRVEHGVFGYAMPDPRLARVLAAALERSCGWRVAKSASSSSSSRRQARPTGLCG